MSDQGPRDLCPEHSGVKAIHKIILWLIGILITLIVAIGSTQTMLLMSLKSEIASFSYRFTNLDGFSKDITAEVRELQQRVTRLERQRSHGE